MAIAEVVAVAGRRGLRMSLLLVAVIVFAAGLGLIRAVTPTVT